MRTDRTVTRSDKVANKDEQWPSIHEADFKQNRRCMWKHYLPSKSVTGNYSSRMRTNHAVTRVNSDRVANKDEQWQSSQ